jgi:hypothetical protein
VLIDKIFTLSPDTGAGGGGSGAEEPGQSTVDPAGGEDLESGVGLEGLELNKEQQAKFDLVIAKRLERERDRWSKEVESARERAKKEAEETRLAEQQQFQELANRRQSTIEEQASQIKDLEESADLAKKYAKALTVYRDALIANVPEHIVTLLKPMDVADQLSWLSQNAQQQSGDGDRGYVGPPPAPGGKGSNNGLSHEEKRKKAYLPRSL